MPTPSSVLSDDSEDRLPADAPSAEIQKNGVSESVSLARLGERQSIRKPGGDRFDCFRANWNLPLPVALSGQNRRFLLEVETREIEVGCLAYPGAGRIEKLEQSPVATATPGRGIRCLDQANGPVDRQRLGEGIWRPRLIEQTGRDPGSPALRRPESDAAPALPPACGRRWLAASPSRWRCATKPSRSAGSGDLRARNSRYWSRSRRYAARVLSARPRSAVSEKRYSSTPPARSAT